MTAISWKSGISGNWSTATDWNPASIPGATSQVTIGVAGASPYTVSVSLAESAATLLLNAANASLQVNNTLTMVGALTLTSGTLDLAGVIKGGQLVLNGGSLAPGGGTLDGVKLQGTLQLTQSFGSPLIIKDGLTLTNLAGSGPGAINLTGLGAALNFAPGVQTLTSAVAGQRSTISIGSTAGDGISELSAVGTISTATLGALVTTSQAGQLATLTASSQAGDSLVNQGFINAAVAGGTFTINGGSFANTGTITANLGDTVTIATTNFSNTGTINVLDTGTLNLGQSGAWTSTGVISETDATVNLLGNVTTAEVKAITSRAGGLIDLAGTLALGGGTLNVGTGTAIGDLLLTGGVSGGTIHDAGLGMQFGTGSFPQSTLTNVTYQGALDLSEPALRMTVLGTFAVTGASGTGPGAINLTGANSNLTMSGSRTLDNATLRIGAASLGFSNPGTTTAVVLGPHLTIDHAGTSASQFGSISATITGSSNPGDSLLNQGDIFGSLQNGSFAIQDFGTFTNAGAIGFGNGDNLSINAGTVTNQNTITLGNGLTGQFGGSVAFNNPGLISGGAGDTVTLSGETLTNAGTVSIGAGSTLGITGFSSFVNQGTLSLGAIATLNIGSTQTAWSSTGKIISGGATVNLQSIVTQAQIGAVTRGGGDVIDIAGTLTDTGATLNVGTGSAFGSLELGGTIVGGVIHNGGAGLTFVVSQFGAAPQLNGVSYQGPLDLSEANARVDVQNGIVLTGTAGTGAGLVNLTGAGAQLLSTGTSVLDNATIDFGAPRSANFSASIATVQTFSGLATLLTLGSHLIVQQVGQLGTIAGPTGFTDMLINRGTINAGATGGSLTISGNQFENLGVVTVSNGDFLNITSSSFINPGTVTVLAGATIGVGAGGDWISTGKLAETGATVLLNGDVTLPEIGAITRSDGTLVIDGQFNNLGATMNVGTASALGDFVLAGTIDDGIIHDAGGGLVFQGGTLDSLTYQGVVDLSEGAAALTILGGLTATDITGTKAGTINLTGGDSTLTLQEPQTLDNATVDIGSGLGDTLQVTQPFFESFGATGWTATLGSKLVIQQTGAVARLAASDSAEDTLINKGKINAVVAGGTFSITGANFTNAGSISVGGGDTMNLATSVTNTGSASFTNTGSLTVTTGGILNLGNTSFQAGSPWTSTGLLSETNGTINLIGPVTLANLNSITRSGGLLTMSSTADLGGGTLSVGTGAALGAIMVSGTIQNGTIKDAGSGLAFTAGAALGNVTEFGTLSLAQNSASLVISGSIALAGLAGTGKGTILLTGPGSTLVLLGVEALNNANLSLGGGTLAAASSGFAFENPILGNLTLGPSLTITHTASSDGSIGTAEITSTLGFQSSAGGVITNQGAINSGLSGGSLEIAGSTFVNQGTMVTFHGDAVAVNTNTFGNAGSMSVNAATLTIGSPGASNFNLGSFSNTGSVTVTGGGTLNLGNLNGSNGFTWTSAGTLSETSATINLNGPVTLADLNSITRSGGTITVAGTADLGGGTLNVGTGSKLGALVVTGVIQNGTVHDADQGLEFQGFGAKLSNVAYHGTMDFSVPASMVTVTGGLTLAGLSGTGAATILLTGAGSAIDMAGVESLANALVDLGGGASLLPVAGALAAQLTLASSVSIVDTGGGGTIGNGTAFGASPAAVINQGSIIAMIAGSAITISGSSFANGGVVDVGSGDTMSITAASFSNTGTVAVTTGGVLNLGQAFGATAWTSTGKLSETGATINLSGTETLANLTAITRSGGEINFQGSLNGAGGTLNVGSGSALGTLQDTGTISTTIIHDAGSGLLFFGPVNSSGARAILIGDTYEGAMNLSSTLAVVTVKNGLTATGAAGTGNGLINLTGAGAVLYAQGAETFNAMTVNLGNAAPLGSTLCQTDPSALGAVLTLGAGLTINQVGINANILGARNLGDQIVNDGNIVANLAGGQFLISQGAFINAGTMVVGAGDTMTLTPDSSFQNQGLLHLTGGTIVTPTMNNVPGGTVLGFGTFNGPIGGGGAVEALGGTLLLNQSSGGEAAKIDAGAILRINGSVVGGLVTFASTASGILALGTPATATAVIGGFAGADEIDLIGKVATGLAYSTTTDVLTVTGAGAVTLATLHFSGSYALANFGHIPDGNGGTLITFVAGGGGSGIVASVNAATVAAPAMRFIAPQASVSGAAGDETLLLPAIGAGVETVTQFGLGGDLGQIGDLFSTTQSGGNTFVNVAPSGHGGGSTIAVLAGFDTTLAQLTAHHTISYS